MTEARIDRGFVRIGAGQVHYRSAGEQTPGGPLPLYMAHAGPGSSLGLAPFIAQLGLSRRVIAPDMLGNGDSDAPALTKTSMSFYADCALRVMDGLGLDKIDFYGFHTGAHIGLELAIAHPDRIRRLVMDGLALFDADLKADLKAHYAPRMEPNDFGGQLAWAWNFVRDQAWHFPYFRRDPAHRLPHTMVPPAAGLHLGVVDVLKALSTYHLAYHAAFEHDVAARAPLLKTEALVMCVETDPLNAYREAAAALIPGVATKSVVRDQRVATIQAFLDA
jgi:pimeloyl-ACP methyl ester carboxylesterase